MKYKHLIDYDEASNKLIISRIVESGESHLYTEIALDHLSAEQKNFESIAAILGRALILDTPSLRDRVD